MLYVNRFGGSAYGLRSSAVAGLNTVFDAFEFRDVGFRNDFRNRLEIGSECLATAVLEPAMTIVGAAESRHAALV
jgi:hypothetical protein